MSITRLRLSIMRCTGENRFQIRPQDLVESWVRITRSVYLSAVQEVRALTNWKLVGQYVWVEFVFGYVRETVALLWASCCV